MSSLPIIHEADYVIVGAGSAGSYLAAELVKDGKTSVVVIEAGSKGRNPMLGVPLMTGILLRTATYTWQYKTAPQSHLNNREISWPRGRVVGGSGAINGMVWVRGLAADYDGWAKDAGLNSWNWEQVRPVFEKLEALPSEDGKGKALGIERPEWWTELYDAYLAGAREIGEKTCENFNGPDPEGAGRYNFNIRDGRRAHTGRLLKAAEGAGKLRIITEALTHKLVLHEGRARDVLISQGNKQSLVRAKREIILSAGAAGSAPILMRSGIGDPEVLARAGVRVAVENRGIGKGLQDHLLVRVEHAAVKQGALNRLLRVDRAGLAMAQAMLFGKGPASCFPLLTGGYFKSTPDQPIPDLQSHFMPALSSAALRINPFKQLNGVRTDDGFFANIFQMRPESRGTIEITSGDAHAAPKMDPNYLAEENDRVVLRNGVKRLRAIFGAKSFDGLRGKELAPGLEYQSDEALDAWISQTAESVFHPTGGCCMGAHKDSALDSQLRVRGVEGLRVCDASVMPRVTSNNTNAPTVMIAARCAEFLRAA